MEVPVGTKLKPIIEFHGIRAHHLAFAASDSLELTDNSRTDGWWTAKNLTTGKDGLIPSNFVEAQLSPTTRARMEEKARNRSQGYMKTVKDEKLTEQQRAKGIQELRLMSYSMGSLCQDMYDYGLMPSFKYLLRYGKEEKTWEEAGLIMGRTTYLVKEALKELINDREWVFPLIYDRLNNLSRETRDSNFGIMSIMNSICIDQDLHQYVIDGEIVPLMLKHLENDPGVRAEMPQESAKCIKNLCYREKNRKYLVSIGIIEVLQHFAPRTDISNETREMVKGALTYMEKYKAETTSETGKYIMISYEWGSRKQVLAIKDYLEMEGYNVWIKNTKQGMVDKMASSVEACEVFCIAVTQKYCDSDYCKLEAHYAQQLKKTMVPLIMEPGAGNIGGWIKLTLATKMHIDFSAPSKLKSSLVQLANTLGDRCKGGAKDLGNDLENYLEAMKACNEAREAGLLIEPLNRTRVCLVGKGRAGKTCLSKSLRGEPFDAEEESTRGRAACQVTFSAEKAELQNWKHKADDMPESDRLALLNIARRMNMKEGEVEDAIPQMPKDGVYLENPDDESGKDVASNLQCQQDLHYEAGMTEEVPVNDKKMSKAVKESVKRGAASVKLKQKAKAKNGGSTEALPEPTTGQNTSAVLFKEEEDRDVGVRRLDAGFLRKHQGDLQDIKRTVIDLIDFGGQQVFYSLHHILLTSSAVYVVVFSMMKLLDQIEGRVKVKQTEAGELDENDTLSYMDFWMHSLEQHAPHAPIVLVGTFKDKINKPEQLKKISQVLTERFGPKGLLGNVQSNKTDKLVFFPCDNSRTLREDGVEQVQTVLEELAENLPMCQAKVDVRIVEYVDVLMALSRAPKDDVDESQLILEIRAKYSAMNSGVQRLNLEEMRQIAVQCQLIKERATINDPFFRSVLDFLRKTGTIFHFHPPQVDNTVFLDPEYLVERITCIIRDYELHELAADGILTGDKSLYSHFVNLKEKGLLHPSLLPYLWKGNTSEERQTLLQLLLHFHLASAWVPSASYTISSLLPLRDLNATDARGRQPSGTLFIALASHQLDVRPVDHGLSSDFLVNQSWLPTGFFAQFVCRLVDFAARAGGVEPKLFRNHADFTFGSCEIEVSLHPIYHVIVIKTFSRNGLTGAFYVLRALEQTMEVSFPNLRMYKLLYYKDSDFVTLSDVQENYAQKQAFRIGTEKKRGTSLLKVKDMEQLYGPWLPQPPPTNGDYDVMISYRQATDQDFARSLETCLSLEAVGANGSQPTVFLDRKSLRTGERFDLSFMQAIVSCQVCVPLVSSAAIATMGKSSSREDSVLLEWMVMTYFAAEGRIEKILPIFIGQMEGQKMTDFFSNFQLDSVPDRLHKPTHNHFVSFVKEYAPDLPDPKERTIREVVYDLLHYSGVQSWTFQKQEFSKDEQRDLRGHGPTTGKDSFVFGLWGVHEQCAKHVCRALRDAWNSAPKGTIKQSKKKVQKAPSSKNLAAATQQLVAAPIYTNSLPIAQWNLEDVAAWLRDRGFAKHCNSFAEQDVEGGTLLMLTVEDLVEECHMSKLNAKAIIKARDQLVEDQSTNA